MGRGRGSVYGFSFLAETPDGAQMLMLGGVFSLAATAMLLFKRFRHSA
jgi:hypothetical protein